jgi:hypothetical protein
MKEMKEMKEIKEMKEMKEMTCYAGPMVLPAMQVCRYAGMQVFSPAMQLQREGDDLLCRTNGTFYVGILTFLLCRYAGMQVCRSPS